MSGASELSQYFENSRNPALVFSHVLGGSSSRIEVAKRSGLDRASVTRAVSKLISIGVLKESSTSVSPVATGRPRVLLTTDDENFWIVAIHIGVHSVAVTRVGIGGTFFERVVHRHDKSVEDVLAQTLNAIEEVRARTPIEPLGIGLAVGGWIDPESQEIIEFPGLGWSNVDLRSDIARETGLDVTIWPMAVSHAQSNLLYGLVGPQETFGHLYIGSIVEYAIASEGEIWRGHRGSGGMIETIPLRLGDGTFATVKDAVSDEGLVDTAVELGLITADDDFERLLEIASEGDNEQLQELLNQRARNVGLLICQLQEVITVPKLVVSASIMRQNKGVEIIKDTIAKHSQHVLSPQIIGGGEVAHAHALAAASALMKTILEPNG